MPENLKLDAVWTDDCQGKKDYDGDILSISTRYWPRGGGFHIFDRNNPQAGMQGNEARPEIKPSATSSLIVRYRGAKWREQMLLANANFEGATFDEIKPQVEAWAQAQMDRAISVLKREFGEPKP